MDILKEMFTFLGEGVKILGAALAAWGVFDIGSGYSAGDGSSITNGLKRLVGGGIVAGGAYLLTTLIK